MKLFCKLPFSRISIDDDGNIWPACCPDWVEFPLGNVFTQKWDDIWYGEAAKKFRDSMYDGSLQYCKKEWCPNVADAEAGIDNFHVVPHRKRPPEWTGAPPIHLNMNYDQTCNLKCPSCRTDFIHYKGDQLDKVQHIQKYVEEQILPTVESIALTGVGDPFYSPVFRSFLQNFDTQKYPHIKTIHFHTNGQLFDEKMYDRMKGLHHLNLSTDISIDAASADVYNKVRPPGNWDRLIKNLQFIKGLDNIVNLGISMVVQQDNYKQMMSFVELGESLVNGNRPTFVEFKRIRQQGHLTSKAYETMGMDDISPEMKEDFLTRLTQIEAKRKYNARHRILPSINHNLHEYLSQTKTSPLSRLSSMISSIAPSSLMKLADRF